MLKTAILGWSFMPYKPKKGGCMSTTGSVHRIFVVYFYGGLGFLYHYQLVITTGSVHRNIAKCVWFIFWEVGFYKKVLFGH